MPENHEDTPNKPAPSRKPLERYTDRDQLAPQGYPAGKRPPAPPKPDDSDR